MRRDLWWRAGDLPAGSGPGGLASGFVLTRPHMSIDLQAVAGRRVIVSTLLRGTCDTLLLVRSPQGQWIYNRDGGRADAQLVVAAAVETPEPQ